MVKHFLKEIYFFCTKKHLFYIVDTVYLDAKVMLFFFLNKLSSFLKLVCKHSLFEVNLMRS